MLQPSVSKIIWATQPESKQCPRTTSTIVKNYSQKILDFPIFVKTFEKQSWKPSWTFNKIFQKKNNYE